MRKTLWLIQLLTVVCYIADSAPASLGTLELDKLDTDFDELAYEVDEEDLDSFVTLLDEADATSNDDNAKKQSKKTTGKSSMKSKNNSKKGSKTNRNIQNLKNFFKESGSHDRAEYNDDDVYVNADRLAAQAVGIKGKEDKKYRKGTKTRGFHRVHHKDEYKKDKVIYDDDETKGIISKIGAKVNGYKTDAGVGFSKGHTHHDRHNGLKSRQRYIDKGATDRQYKGYSDSQGFESDF